MNFGKYVKILRKDNFLTQEEFANKLGVSRQTVSNWEQNITTPNLNDIEKISNIDGYLIGGSSSKIDEFIQIIEEIDKKWCFSTNFDKTR